jgi:hypothetical protein
LTVAATLAVSVLVMDCTTIGAPPPTTTPATSTATVACRGRLAEVVLTMAIVEAWER